MFSLGVCIIFINLISNCFDFYFNYVTLELEPIFLNAAAIPVKPKKRIRSYMPKEEKIRVSNNIPNWFNQVVCGLMLSDATIRMHGSQALMGIQQTHQELTQEVWKCVFN